MQDLSTLSNADLYSMLKYLSLVLQSLAKHDVEYKNVKDKILAVHKEFSFRAFDKDIFAKDPCVVIGQDPMKIDLNTYKRKEE